jgi:hypothetical protein
VEFDAEKKINGDDMENEHGQENERPASPGNFIFLGLGDEFKQWSAHNVQLLYNTGNPNSFHFCRSQA